MSLDFLQTDHVDDLPLFAALSDKTAAIPFFNKWQWLPHPETNAKSGIFVRCNHELVDDIIDLPERIKVQYGIQFSDVRIPAEHVKSLQSEIVKPTDNSISVRNGSTLVMMRFGKFNGKYYDLSGLFEFFRLVVEHYRAGTVKGVIGYGPLSFAWKTLKRMRNFIIKFAAAFYEWDIPWTPTR